MDGEGPIVVTLNPFEMMVASVIGCERISQSRQQNHKHRYMRDGDEWRANVDGAAGEIAAAKALGLYWGATVNTFRAPDIEPRIQVKTAFEHHYDLVIDASANDNEVYVLVTGTMPEFWVHGAILASQGKQQQWWAKRNSGPPAYWVPQSELKPIRECIGSLANEIILMRNAGKGLKP